MGSPENIPGSAQSGKSGADDVTLLTPKAVVSGETRASVEQSRIESQGSVLLPYQDLSGDKLLQGIPTIRFATGVVPALGGIPILARIGHGGMGTVYYGVRVMLRQEVAIKVLPAHMAQQEPDLVQRFIREAQIAASIESPHLVRVTDVSESSGLFYLVMEYVNGPTAGGLLKKVMFAGRKGLDEASALELCIAATTGLAAAHAGGVVHRDVKPDNILVPLDKQTGMPLLKAAKIADLGLAKAEGLLGSLTGTQSAMGTPGFIAPEQAISAHKAGPPADVFAMGATLYALVTGHPPFQGSSVTEAIIAAIQQPHVSLREMRHDVSEATDFLVDRCLGKDPSTRYANASELLSALKTCREALGSQHEEQRQTLKVLSELNLGLELGPKTFAPNPGSTLAGLPPMSAIPPSLPAVSAKDVIVQSQNTNQPVSIPAPQFATTPASIESPAPLTSTPATTVRQPAQSGSRRFFLVAAGVALTACMAGIFAFLHFRKSGLTNVGVAYSSDKKEWLKWAAAEFAKTPEGKNFSISLYEMSPMDAHSAILSGDTRIHAWTLPSTLYRETFEQAWKTKFHSEAFEKTEHLALVPLCFFMFEDRYQAFTDHYHNLNFITLGQALQEKTGWDAIAKHPEWSGFSFGISNPFEQNSGLAALMLLAYGYNHKENCLLPEDLSAGFKEALRAYVPVFTAKGSPSDVIKEMVLRGPSSYDGILTYESLAIQNLKLAEGRWGGARIAYPDINLWNDHPYYVLNAPWSGEDERRGATAFMEYLLSEPVQIELLKHGFRPGNPKVSILGPESPFSMYAKRGLKLEVPVAVETPSADVLEGLKAAAKQVMSEKK